MRVVDARKVETRPQIENEKGRGTKRRIKRVKKDGGRPRETFRSQPYSRETERIIIEANKRGEIRIFY